MVIHALSGKQRVFVQLKKKEDRQLLYLLCTHGEKPIIWRVPVRWSGMWVYSSGSKREFQTRNKRMWSVRRATHICRPQTAEIIVFETASTLWYLITVAESLKPRHVVILLLTLFYLLTWGWCAYLWSLIYQAWELLMSKKLLSPPPPIWNKFSDICTPFSSAFLEVNNKGKKSSLFKKQK